MGIFQGSEGILVAPPWLIGPFAVGSPRHAVKVFTNCPLGRPFVPSRRPSPRRWPRRWSSSNAPRYRRWSNHAQERHPKRKPSTYKTQKLTYRTGPFCRDAFSLCFKGKDTPYKMTASTYKIGVAPTKPKPKPTKPIDGTPSRLRTR